MSNKKNLIAVLIAPKNTKVLKKKKKKLNKKGGKQKIKLHHL